MMDQGPTLPPFPLPQVASRRERAWTLFGGLYKPLAPSSQPMTGVTSAITLHGHFHLHQVRGHLQKCQAVFCSSTYSVPFP